MTSSSAQGHVKIDEGAFGEIDRAKWRGKSVVVKTVVQVGTQKVLVVLNEPVHAHALGDASLSCGASAVVKVPSG